MLAIVTVVAVAVVVFVVIVVVQSLWLVPCVGSVCSYIHKLGNCLKWHFGKAEG